MASIMETGKKNCIRFGEKDMNKLIILFLVMISLSACELIGLVNNPTNNAIRRIIVEYEVETNGLTQELVIYHQRGETRLDFEYPFEREVWLYEFALNEYFKVRLAERSYIYIDKIHAQEENVYVWVRRSDGINVIESVYYLQQIEDAWQIVEIREKQ